MSTDAQNPPPQEGARKDIDRQPALRALQAGCLGLGQRLLRFCFWWPIVLAIGFFVFRYIGESLSLVACALYLPWALWLLPLVPLALILAAQRRWLGLVALFSYLAICFTTVMDWRLPNANMLATDVESRSGFIRVLTNNGGDRGFQGMDQLAVDMDADFVALQEAYKVQNKLDGRFEGYEQHRQDEFVLLSKWPVTEASTIYLDRGDRRLPCAGRFVAQVGLQPVVIYNVHMPTPRFFFQAALRRPLLLLRFGGRTSPSEADFWRQKANMTRELATLICAESLPTLVVGDFNMTPGGSLYRQFIHKTQLLDTHRHAGSGFGMTFPFDRKGWSARLQPWLRIDYIFASKHWKAISQSSHRIRGEPRQHLPLSSELLML